MSNVPAGPRYLKSHEWARLEPTALTVGISDHAQQALGDLVFVEVPEVGRDSPPATPARWWNPSRRLPTCISRWPARSWRSTPSSAAPELINQDPYGAGWIMRDAARDARRRSPSLLDAEAYAAALAAETH